MRKIFNVENIKYFVIIFILIIGIFFLEISNDFNFEDLSTSTSNIESDDITITDVKSALDVTLVSGVDLIPNSKKVADMQKNTKNLQAAIDKVSESGGGVVYLPTGTFYFSQGGIAAHGNEDYVIRCRNNVHLKGSGTNENNTNNLTILKPYYYSPKADGGMDMFYFNNYADTGYNNTSNVTTSTKRDVTYTDMNGTVQTLKSQTVYLINADFSDFIIDGDESRGGIAACSGSYKTDGKGFMINLFKDCDWNNIVVKNTDATGFGIDCPINSTMTNCKAINCGKAATQSDGGASGFGIGTGYSNDESLIITNCVAINNKKFGFFFEHQSRFSSTYYPATTSKGFVVSNSIAGGNMYDFGGLKAYDVTYENVQSISGKGNYTNTNFKKTTASTTDCNAYTTITYSNSTSIKLNTNTQPIYFSMYSKNNYLINANITNYVTDITSNTTENKWAINNGIIPLSTQTTYKPGNTMTRFEIIRSLWRYANMPGTITTVTTTKDISNSQKYITETIGFTDLGSSIYQYDLDSIIWAYQNGIISKDTKFNPSTNCTRAQFVTMLYRLAGSPSTSGTIPFTDVSTTSYYYKAVVWGYNVGIIKGSSNSTFTPDRDITKNEVAIFLYRYQSLASNTYSITYNLNGGTVSGNPTSYKQSSATITLKNPTKSGYTFTGWTGSNGATASTSVSIKNGTIGNLVYTANWKANLSSISVKTKPTKTSYYTGDKVSTSGLVLNAYYTDSSVEAVTGGYTISPTTLTTSGTKKITVTYSGKTTSFNVNVQELEIAFISINTKPTKLVYYVGDSLDTTGLVLNVKYNNGTTKTIISGYTASPTTLSTVGTQKITITYGNKTTTYDVVVSKNDVKSIAIKTVPQQTTYYEGDVLDTTGLVLKVTYNDGTTKDVKSGYTVDPINLETTGKQPITVTYASKTTTFNVTVKKVEISSISIKNLPLQTTYYVGDSFSSEGLVILAQKNSGYVEEITTGFNVSLADGTKLTETGTQAITVTYNNIKTTFNIEVSELQKESLILVSRPTKTNYLIGEAFSLDGLQLQYIDSYNKKNNITTGYTTSIKNGTILNDAGTRNVIVTYQDKQVSFDIEVSKVKTIEVNEKIIKKEYNVGETFELESLSLTATYQDNTKEKVTSGYEVQIDGGTTFTNEGEKEVIITYGGATTKFIINVSSTEETKPEDEQQSEETGQKAKKKSSFNILFVIIPIVIIFIIGVVLFKKYKENQEVDY